jgi:hypothetical protein
MAATRGTTTEPGEPVAHADPLVVHLPPLRPAIGGMVSLIVESVVLPTVLFALLLHTVSLTAALLGSLGWCWLCVAVRIRRGDGAPGTLLLTTAILTARTLVALATSSAFLYLLQPILSSVVMAALFIGSALLGRPLTVRIVGDFVDLPRHVLTRARVHRMFCDVAVLWGASRMLSALVGYQLLRLGTDAALVARGLLGPVLTVGALALCIWWGVRALAADGVELRRAAPVPAAG